MGASTVKVATYYEQVVYEAGGNGQRCTSKYLQRRMRLEVVDELVEIVGSCPYFASKYLA